MPASNRFFSAQQNAVFVAVLAAVAIPFRISGVAVEQSILGVALLAAIAQVWASPPVRVYFRNALFSRQGLLISAVFFAWVVVLPFSHDPMESLKIGGRTGVFILAAVLVGCVIRDAPKYHDLMWKVLIASAVGLGVAAVISLLGVEQVLALLTADFDGDVQPKRILKAYATAIVCVVPVVVLAGRRLGGAWAIWGYAYILIAVAIVFLTETRSAMAGMMSITIAFLLMVALRKHKRWKEILLAVLVVVSIVLMWVRNERYIYAARYSDMTYLPGWLIDPHRQDIWKFVFEKFLEHPFVGNGIDQLNKLPGAHEIIHALGPSAYVVPSHPHNWMLEILSETGLIGFIPVIVALGYMAWRTAKGFLFKSDEFALAKLLLLAGFLTCSLFSFSIWAVWWQLVFYILFAIMWAVRSAQSDKAENEA